MHINDVGQNTWEEVNVGGAGRNYGWPGTEGDFTQTQLPELHPPVLRLLATAAGRSRGSRSPAGRSTTRPPNQFPA